MKRIPFSISLKIFTQSILVFSILYLAFGSGSVSTASADAPSGTESCDQLFAKAEAQFLSTLAPDGSVPATPETRAAAQEYIRVSKLCYDEIESQNSIGALQGETPTFIDDGGVLFNNGSSAEFVTNGQKWGASAWGTPGGTVTYSFMGNGISFSAEKYGNSTAIASLPGFQACFITEIQNAFAAWQAVSNIQFVQVADSGSAFNTPEATGDIRIGAHYFDGPSGTLAHAYYPPPNGSSASGDLHFDSSEHWTCNTSGIDFGIVALHEIGHSLGLGHENTSKVAIMDPYYNSSLTSLQSDDISGSVAIYGPVNLAAAPINDDFSGAKAVGSVPYSDTLDTTGANAVSDNPADTVTCDGKVLRKGTKNVWYRYKSLTTRPVSFDTMGSNYDAYIAVWTGSNVNSLSLVGCNDDNDTNTGLQAQFTFTAQADVQYYIEVAQYNGEISGAPSPATGGTLKFHATTFRDVAGDYWAWRWIEGFYNEGITIGCSQIPFLYCPERQVTRAEMAVFILRAKHGSSYQPTPSPTGMFADVPVTGKEWMKPWIEQYYNEGITTGCYTSPLRYCPERQVTRAEMAVFILRAKYGSNYQPNPSQTGIFADVPVTGKEWMQPWIEEFYEQGITSGCGQNPLRYCPERPVTRAEMAVFIDRAFSIPQLP